MKIIPLFLALAALSTPVIAKDLQSGSWQVGNDSFHIHYADLDTTKAADRARLLVRVEKAAARLCIDDIERSACIADMIDNSANPAVRQALAERVPRTLASR